MLDIVGISPEAEKTYEALLTRGHTTVEQLVAETELSDHEVRAALRTLEKHGAVRRIPGSPPKFGAVDPGIALDVLLLHQEERVKQARARALELSEQFHRAVGGRDPTKLIEILTGRQAVVERVDQILSSARDQIRGLDTAPYSGQVISANLPERDLLARGGRARVIYDRVAIEQPGRLADLEEGVAWGEQARTLPKLPMKLLLIDDRIGAVPLQATPSAIESTILVHPSGLLQGLSALFESLWQVALPLDLERERGPNPPNAPDEPSRDERRILSLLTAGLPDEAVARQLGMSDRTYQRRMHDLMERLQVQTRFQLARQTIRRGWIEGPDTDEPQPDGIRRRHSARLNGVTSTHDRQPAHLAG